MSPFPRDAPSRPTAHTQGAESISRPESVGVMT
jgi:hypothetical protein